MKDYYLNLNPTNNPNGNHEVHSEDCILLPKVINRIYLGCFENGIPAVAAAKELGYAKVDGCYLCCKEAHKE